MKLTFFDIDGTLAIGTKVPSSAETALAELHKNGTFIFICTGRPLVYAKKYFSRYANGYIVNNGRLAVSADNSEHIYEAPLKEDFVDIIRNRLEGIGAAYVFYGERQGFFGGNPKGFDRMREIWDEGFLTLQEPGHTKLYSFDVWFENDAMRNEIEMSLQDICILNPHGPHPTADVTIIGSDKGTAIRTCMEKLNVSREDTYGFGDGINDLSMMQAAGHSIAMGNACESVKKAAEYVTDPIDQDGIANALKHYHLI